MTTISSDVIRGYNDTIILYLLLDRPSYGYEISRMIWRRTGISLLFSRTRRTANAAPTTVLRMRAESTTERSARSGTSRKK